MTTNIVAFSGSLRKESFTTKLLKAFGNAAPSGITLTIYPIDNIPFINQDLEDNLPETVLQLQQAIRNADAVIFATPEYNRSYSPILKNAIDWGSRPEAANPWDKKPAAIIGCSPYRTGAFGAVHHLRQVLSYVNVYALQQPELYFSDITKTMDDQGNIIDENVKQLIAEFWQAFTSWINTFKK